MIVSRQFTKIATKCSRSSIPLRDMSQAIYHTSDNKPLETTFAKSIKEWDPRDEKILPPKYDPKNAQGQTEYIFNRLVYRKQLKAIRDDWRGEVGEWERKEAEGRLNWYKTLTDFKNAKAAERKRRSDVKAEIRVRHDKKLNAINRYNGLMAAKRRWHTKIWKENKLKAMLDDMEEESKRWPQWHNMDDILTPENFHKTITPMWKDWEPSADLMRAVVMDNEERKIGPYDRDDHKDLRQIMPYGSDKMEMPEMFMPTPDPYEEVAEMVRKRRLQASRAAADTDVTSDGKLLTFEDIEKAITSTTDDWTGTHAVLQANNGYIRGEVSTDENDDYFMGPNWTYYNAVRSENSRPGKRPFPWGSGNPKANRMQQVKRADKRTQLEKAGLDPDKYDDIIAERENAGR